MFVPGDLVKFNSWSGINPRVKHIDGRRVGKKFIDAQSFYVIVGLVDLPTTIKLSYSDEVSSDCIDLYRGESWYICFGNNNLYFISSVYNQLILC